MGLAGLGTVSTTNAHVSSDGPRRHGWDPHHRGSLTRPLHRHVANQLRTSAGGFGQTWPEQFRGARSCRPSSHRRTNVAPCERCAPPSGQAIGARARRGSPPDPREGRRSSCSSPCVATGRGDRSDVGIVKLLSARVGRRLTARQGPSSTMGTTPRSTSRIVNRLAGYTGDLLGSQLVDLAVQAQRPPSREPERGGHRRRHRPGTIRPSRADQPLASVASVSALYMWVSTAS